MKKYLLNISIVILFTSFLMAQEFGLQKSLSSITRENSELANSTMRFIPSLKTLIDSALVHSPIIKARTTEIEIAHEELKITNKKWMDYIYLEGFANYGLYDQVTINGQAIPGNSKTGMFSKNELMQYYAGISIKLPISSIFSRANESEINELNIEHANYILKEYQKHLTEIIIKEYYNLKYLKESMGAFLDVYKTLEISYKKAQNDLENGRIQFDDFALLVSTLGKAKAAYFKSMNDYFAQYLSLQNITGISFGEGIES